MSNDRLLGVVLIAALALIIGWVLYVGRSVLVPIVFALLIVYVIVGVNRLLARIPMVGARIPALLLSTFSVLVILLALAAGVSLLASNVGKVIEMAPRLQDSLLEQIQAAATWFGIEVAPTWTTLRDGVLERVDLQAWIGPAVTSMTSMLVGLFIVLLYVTFMLIERQAMSLKLDRLSDNRAQVRRVRQILNKVNNRIGRYLALKTLVNVVLGVVSWLIMVIAGLELAAFWAVLIAVLNYVPYIGSFLGVLFPVAFALVQIGEPGVILSMAIGLVAAQFVIGNLLDPFLMGNSLNLSPFVILATLAIWSSLWGIAGAFLSVPMTAVVALALSEFKQTRPIAVMLSRNGRV